MADEFDLKSFVLEDMINQSRGLMGLKAIKADAEKNPTKYVGDEGDVNEFKAGLDAKLKGLVGAINSGTEAENSTYINRFLQGDELATLDLLEKQTEAAKNLPIDEMVRKASLAHAEKYSEARGFTEASDDAKKLYGFKVLGKNKAVMDVVNENFKDNRTLMSLIVRYAGGADKALGSSADKKKRKEWIENMEKQIDALVDAYLFDKSDSTKKRHKEVIKSQASAIVAGKAKPFSLELLATREHEIMSAMYNTMGEAQLFKACKEPAEQYAVGMGYKA